MFPSLFRVKNFRYSIQKPHNSGSIELVYFMMLKVCKTTMLKLDTKIQDDLDINPTETALEKSQVYNMEDK
jgi:hypothetical protein